MTNDEGRGGRSAAWGIAGGILGAAAIAAWQVAIAAKSTFPILPAYVCGGLTVAALYMCFATVWGWWPTRHTTAVPSPDTAELMPPSQVEAAAVPEATSVTGPAAIDRWRLRVNDVSSEVLQLQNNGMSHPGYMSRSASNVSPSVRIGMRVACAPLDPSTPTTSEVRARFLAFLGHPQILDLIGELTTLNEGVAWRAWDDNPRHNFAAILSSPDEEKAPVAWARLLLPEEMTRRYGRDFRCAYFVLYVEPRTDDGSPALAASLLRWHKRLCEVLRVPAALAGFLAEQLSLSTLADPAVEVGVWLKASSALTELINVDGYSFVGGSPQSNWYMGFGVADEDGEPPNGLVDAWLRQLCDSELHLDGYEAHLASLRSGSKGVGADQRDDVGEVREQQSTLSAADVLAQRLEAEWATDISLFTKLKQQLSFEVASAALRRGAELNLISKHGIRAPLEHTSVYLRIPHPDNWPSDGIPLHIEARWLENIVVHEWASGQPFVDVFLAIATKLRSSVHWEGEQFYNPEATFEQFASLLLYGVEMVRRGFGGVINRILQIVGDDWIITEWELIDKANHYQILFTRFDQLDWVPHVTEKGWVNRGNFEEAFGTSQILIYNRIFEGALPPGWIPPNAWPFRIVFGDGSIML